ncbi:hypothetical protein [Nesterenkonia pannonica]|uniref:hypothetical protein n=1 Tax=Nesterenkonia pannonica TaxID=1548602 RepID=UPI002164D633|nr:hypothetical protein [Nesterenkonia pannonica]
MCIRVIARDSLAKDAGLPCSWGVTVGADGRSLGDPHIFAAGDCASVEGRGSSGLIAPGWMQAEMVASGLRDDLGLASSPDRDAAGELVDFAQWRRLLNLDVILVKSRV